MARISPLQQARSAYRPKLPPALRNGAAVTVKEGAPTTAAGDVEAVKALFPCTFGSPELSFVAGGEKKFPALNVGVILSGGQAPGGHNVIAGLFDGIKSLNPDSRLFGFLRGPDGLVKGESMELTAEIIDAYRNTGGFDIIGSGRTKLETVEQFEQARSNCARLGVTALVIIGGDDSNTNACVLAEYFKKTGAGILVAGCPKTIDGDLKNEWIEASFGFDTACRVYSELIGNLCRDANSAKKYWHFVKLMGRSASHIALECALQTQPNYAVISEEVAAKRLTLGEIVDGIAATVAARAERGCNFGIALIPEGLIEFIPEIKVLISELNELLAANASEVDALDAAGKAAFAAERLSAASAAVFNSLPEGIRRQLCNDRDPHGNVQVSLIETEKMLAEMEAVEPGVPTWAIVYGHMPLMITRACPLQNVTDCAHCDKHGLLTDRKRRQFPVRCGGGVRQIYNPVPLYMGDKLKKLPADAGIAWFTLESPAEAARVLDALQKGAAWQGEFTRGLYFKTPGIPGAGKEEA